VYDVSTIDQNTARVAAVFQLEKSDILAEGLTALTPTLVPQDSTPMLAKIFDPADNSFGSYGGQSGIEA
jgi:hypothetical protein